MTAAAIYDRAYYTDRQEDWSASAAALVPPLLRLFPARSVIDVGCRTGNLLAAFAQHGVTDGCGLDGDHVPREHLRIPPAQFRVADLLTLSDVGRPFDIACSLEYANQLPPARAEGFVALLVRAAPVVLFSAAVPGQAGLGHRNAQRQSYWARLFAAHGRVPVDCIRPAVHGAPGVAWYYAQNTLVYCPPARVPEGWSPVTNPLYLDLLDAHVFNPMTRPPDSIRGALHSFERDGAALWRALRRRITHPAVGRRSPPSIRRSCSAPIQPAPRSRSSHMFARGGQMESRPARCAAILASNPSAGVGQGHPSGQAQEQAPVLRPVCWRGFRGRAACCAPVHARTSFVRDHIWYEQGWFTACWNS